MCAEYNTFTKVQRAKQLAIMLIMYLFMEIKSTKIFQTIYINIYGRNKVSLLGVDSLWGDYTFIPADWGSLVVDSCYFALFEGFSLQKLLKV